MAISILKSKVVETPENTIEVAGIKATEAAASSPFVIDKAKIYIDPHHVVAATRDLIIEKIAAMVEVVKAHGAEPILYLTQAPIMDAHTGNLWMASIFLLGKMGDGVFVKYDPDLSICRQTQTVDLKKK